MTILSNHYIALLKLHLLFQVTSFHQNYLNLALALDQQQATLSAERQLEM